MAVVIALLVLAFISMSYVQQEFRIKANNYVKTIHNTNLAVDYSTKNPLNANETVELNFSENQNEKTTVLKKPWGVFDLVSTRSSIRNENFTKHVLLGGRFTSRNSLYLQDENQPLVVVGTTKIEGNTKLPKQGVKRGTIAGNSYTGGQLIYGSVGLSASSLPELRNKNYLLQLCEGRTEFNTTDAIELVENSYSTNSFNERTRGLKAAIALDLRDIKLTGNLIIQSALAIRVHESAILTDVVLIAPTIEILDNVKGNFQVFASKEIKMGKNCNLSYPSGLTLYEKKRTNASVERKTEEYYRIEIGTGSEIRGTVVFLSDNKENTYKSQILLEDGASILGEVYCDGNFELKGTVTGSVFTKAFIANQFGSVYQNHIYNGSILTSDFPNQFSGLVFKDSKQTVAKWLY